MNDRIERASQWFYSGVWGVMTRWFRVPDRPPALPTLDQDTAESFQPARGFLKYLKLQFWIGLALINLIVLVFWLVLAVNEPKIGLLSALPALFLLIVPDILVYLALHLRYDTTWYVMTNRSLRIRRGIWIIHETTITFENVQNVTVRQGPLQRWYGIADVLIETAGGGGVQPQAPTSGSASHCGLIEGVADAHRIRDLLLARLRQSRSAGLGDESTPADANNRWTPAHLAVLRDIRDLVASG